MDPENGTCFMSPFWCPESSGGSKFLKKLCTLVWNIKYIQQKPSSVSGMVSSSIKNPSYDTERFQTDQQIPCFYETQRFITLLIKAISGSYCKSFE